MQNTASPSSTKRPGGTRGLAIRAAGSVARPGAVLAHRPIPMIRTFGQNRPSSPQTKVKFETVGFSVRSANRGPAASDHGGRYCFPSVETSGNNLRPGRLLRFRMDAPAPSDTTRAGPRVGPMCPSIYVLWVAASRRLTRMGCSPSRASAAFSDPKPLWNGALPTSCATPSAAPPTLRGLYARRLPDRTR